MFSFDGFILVIFMGVFCLGLLTLDLSVFEKWHRQLAERIAERCGLYDVYFDMCTTQDLELIRTLRYYEDAYCDSVVGIVSETLSIPEMLLILAIGRMKKALKPNSTFPNLNKQAQTIAHFYIDVAKHKLGQSSPPSGPHARRLSSRWRRRSS